MRTPKKDMLGKFPTMYPFQKAPCHWPRVNQRTITCRMWVIVWAPLYEADSSKTVIAPVLKNEER